MWLSFAPIANYTAAFYGIAVGTVDWFSLVYFAVSPVMGVVAMFLLDTCGLRLPVSAYIMSSYIRDTECDVNFIVDCMLVVKILPYNEVACFFACCRSQNDKSDCHSDQPVR